MVLRRDDLQTTTTATTLSTSRIGRRRCHVLDSANLDAATGERAQRALTARTRRLRLVTTLRAHLDVQRGDTELLASRSDILRRKHRRVRGGFIAISLHLHTAGAPAQGFLAGQIRDVLRGNNGDTRVDVSLSRHRVDVTRDAVARFADAAFRVHDHLAVDDVLAAAASLEGPRATASLATAAAAAGR